jgi:predicted PurR-regulated permease PerM
MAETELKISDPTLRRMVYAIGVMGIIAFGFYTLSLFKGVFLLMLRVLTPFLAAFLVAYILAPVVIALQRQLGLGRIMGTLVLYMIIFLVVFLLLAFLIPKVITQLIELFEILKTSIPVLLDKLAENPYVKLDRDLIETLRQKIEDIQMDYEKILAMVVPGLKRLASGGFEAVGVATRSIFSGVGSVIGFFSFIAFVGIINFYLIIDWEKIPRIVRKMVPLKMRDRAFDILDKIDRAVGGFLRGQLTVSIIVGSLFAIGLFIMGFMGFPTLRNYSVLIGTAAAIGGFIPYLGAIIGVAPAILIILFTGVSWGSKLVALVVVVGLFSAIQAIEGFILQPRIVGRGAGLHPLVVMLALITGAQFGIGGMILAVPLASILRVIVLEFYWKPLLHRQIPPEETVSPG